MSTTQAATTRRTSAISGVLLSLAIAVLFGTALVQDVDAKTKTKVPINERVHTQIHNCAEGGGTASVQSTPFGSAITTCSGGILDGTTCVNTKKSITCSTNAPPPPSPLNDVGSLPTDGVNEEPTSGGANPGGGAGVGPNWDGSWSAEQSGGSDGGGVVLTSYDADQHDKAKHDGKRKHHRRGDRQR